MKVGDLVKGPLLLDHEPAVLGIVVEYRNIPGCVRVIWANHEGDRYVFPHLLEVISETS